MGSSVLKCFGPCVSRFVFLVLTHLDLVMCDPEAKLPPVNPSRYGFGMLQPDKDMRIRYRLKSTQNEMWFNYLINCKKYWLLNIVVLLSVL